MKNYTTIKDLKSDLQSKVLMSYTCFKYRNMRCFWDGSEVRNKLRCDPVNDQQSKAFNTLRSNLEPKIIVDLS